MATQDSIISYVPQPFYVDGTATIVNYTNVAAITNSPGIFDPDLSNYTEVEPTSSAASFAVQIDFNKQSGHLANHDLTLALVGCALLTYEDSGGSPDLDTEFSEDITCKMSANISAVTSELVGYAHNSQDTIHTFDKTPLPSVISGGRSNIVFAGMGAAAAGATGTVYVTIERTAANVAARPHAKLLIGHLFIGADVLITLDPRTFAWTLNVENQRFVARDFGAINSDGTLVKRVTGEIIKIDNYKLIGSEITGVSPIAATVTPSFFDLVKVNTSYPLLFNSYPRPAVLASGVTIDDLNYTARQNFFSVYGFMADPLELNVGEFRDGLNTEYRARFRIQETR
jgi:hypothetical protein